MKCKEELTNLLQSDPKSFFIPSLIEQFELLSRVNLETDITLLKGVW